MTGKRVRVLNVDDREVTRYVNELTLGREGFDVISARSGHEALTAARDNIDVVLLDVHLPDLDGFEVCRQLRTEPTTHAVIILMFSATYVTAENKIAGLDAGADGYLAQPYQPAELRATLRSLLRMRAAEHEAQELARELRAAMATREHFIAMVGHELRNPLATMVTALEMIDLRPEPIHTAQYLAILRRQTASLERIVGDLLDAARFTHGKISIERKLVDLREIAEHSVRSLAEMIRTSGHAIQLDVPSTTVPVQGDAVRLDQVACNLITNAVKYTRSGGHIQVRVSATAEHGRLEVIDDGIGMDAALRARVFEPFVQGKPGADHARGGLGLGLSVVRQLVELHGGRVDVASAGEERGSHFIVELPLAT